MKIASDSLRKKIEELAGLQYKAITILEKCKSCGTCVKFCPLHIRIFNSAGKAITVNTPKSCGGCSVCFHRCPNQAIELVMLKEVK